MSESVCNSAFVKLHFLLKQRYMTSLLSHIKLQLGWRFYDKDRGIKEYSEIAACAEQFNAGLLDFYYSVRIVWILLTLIHTRFMAL